MSAEPQPDPRAVKKRGRARGICPGCMLVDRQVTRGPRGAHQPGFTPWAGTSPHLGGHARNPDQFSVPRQRSISVSLPGKCTCGKCGACKRPPTRFEQLRNGEFRVVVDYRCRRTPAEIFYRKTPADLRTEAACVEALRAAGHFAAAPIGPGADHWVGASHLLSSYIDDPVPFATGSQSVVGGTLTSEPASPAASVGCSELD